MDIDNKILKYVEGTLKKQDKKDFEVLINSDAELKLKVEVLSDLYNNSVPQNPPYQLKEKIYDMVGLNNESFMDIIIKKSSNILNVLTGEDYLINIKPAFITRSNKKSLLFSKDMNGHQIFCDLYAEDDNCFLDLSAFGANEEELENIKFSLNQESNNLLEKYTDIDGHTGSFKINPGTYEINIYNKNIEIGNIKINIS
tara:strand:+ start:121 stop:717 length:597 start_codon:yes stop_codon:yes gene_type:complete